MVARADTSKLQGDLNAARPGVANAMTRMSSTISGKLMGAFGAVAAGMSMLKGIQMAGSLEQNIIAFETMMGSTEKAKDLLADLSDFAAKTPFRMAGIIQAARGLVMFGERQDQVMGTLRMLGNAAAGTSSDFGMLALIFNQVRGVGKLLTQDFRQLSTRGVISLVDIAKHFDVTTEAAQKMLSTGKISFEDLRAILQSLSAEGGRFHNLMEKQSASLLGLWSTLQEELEFFLRDAMTPLVPALKKIQESVIGAAASLRVLFTPELLGMMFKGLGLIVAIKGSLMLISLLLSPLGLLAAAILAVVLANNLFASSTKKVEDASQDMLKVGDKLRSSHLEQYQRLTELSEKQKLTDDEIEETGNIIGTLTSHYGDLGIEMDSVTGKIIIQGDAWKKLTDTMRSHAINQAKHQIKVLTDEINKLSKEGQPATGPKTFLLGTEGLWDLMFERDPQEITNEWKTAFLERAALQARLAELVGGGGRLGVEAEEAEEKETKPGEEVWDTSGLKQSMMEHNRFRKAQIAGIEDVRIREAAAFNEKQEHEMVLVATKFDHIEDVEKREKAMGERVAALKKVQAVELTNFQNEQSRRQEQKVLSFIQGLMTPIELAREKFENIMNLGLGDMWKGRALDKLVGDLQPQVEFAVTGQIGFAEFGKRIQDVLLKPDDPQKKTARETERSRILLGEIKEEIAKGNTGEVALFAP